MCKEVSFVLTKENMYWSRTSDSHSDIIDIIKEHNFNEEKFHKITGIKINKV